LFKRSQVQESIPIPIPILTNDQNLYHLLWVTCILHSPTDPQGLLRTPPPPLLHHSSKVPIQSSDTPRTPQGLLKDSSRSLSITDQRLFRESSRSLQGVLRDFLEVDRFSSNEVSDKLDAIAESQNKWQKQELNTQLASRQIT